MKISAFVLMVAWFAHLIDGRRSDG